MNKRVCDLQERVICVRVGPHRQGLHTLLTVKQKSKPFQGRTLRNKAR